MENYKVKAMVRAELKAVIRAYEETRGGSSLDTINLLLDRYELEDAKRMVATLVNAVSLHDGRIYDGVREWAQSVKTAPTHEELRELGIYGVDSWIHSAHVNEIGWRMKKELEA